MPPPPLSSRFSPAWGETPLAQFPGAFWAQLSCAQLVGVAGAALVGYEWWSHNDFWFGGFLLIVAALLFWRSKALQGRCVSVYLEGFSVKKGGKVHYVRWDEVESFTRRAVRTSINFVPVSTSHTYRVKTRCGWAWTFRDTTQRIEELGVNFENAVCHALLPRVTEQFRRGETVNFGALNLNRTGVSYGRLHVPWNEVSSFSFANGYLRVHKMNDGVRGVLTGGTIVVHVDAVANVVTLLALVKHLGKSA